jgi:hypothetical protein
MPRWIRSARDAPYSLEVVDNDTAFWCEGCERRIPVNQVFNAEGQRIVYDTVIHDDF